MTFPQISLLEVPIIKQIISFYVWIFQIYLMCMPHQLNLFYIPKEVWKAVLTCFPFLKKIFLVLQEHTTGDPLS